MGLTGDISGMFNQVMGDIKKKSGRRKDFLSGWFSSSGGLNSYFYAAVVLVVSSLVMLVLGLLTDRGDMTSSMMIVLSVVLFLSGVVFATFTKDEGIVPGMAAMLYPDASVNLSRIFADLRVHGDAHFIPSEDGFVQFSPVAAFKGYPEGGSDVFRVSGESAGISVRPACSSLYEALCDDYGFVIPDELTPDVYSEILGNVFVDHLRIAGKVTAKQAGDDYEITVEDFMLKDACRTIREESPKCCTASPCPVCSLFACVLCKGLGKPVVILHITQEKNSLKVVLGAVNNGEGVGEF
ncbi:hypothetical protein [Methanoplanus endosymbiosus]|uniref:DUF7982 domain-containing protein n=1 Tax=Methanoplanus endosymbiosus TaxID=33865 RepID=A0A9E7TIB7_9EURY|nr:hypothetical protein [Methanoplanus endosymbiosus]UUX92188.1 hypothetical protein L6E24_12645 [Methanoplanus endosymbiosus]